MMNDFLGDGILFSGRISLTIAGIGAGGDESAEAFIAWMGSNVHTSAGEDVVVGHDDGRSVELIERWVAAHDDGRELFVCVFVMMRKLLELLGDFLCLL